MEHAHTTPASSQDRILAAFLEPGTLPEIAARVNMSLAALATWTNKNLELLEGVHKALITRCKLIAAHLELSALTALSTVSSAVTSTDDPKLRERALERQRKAANAILRHKPGATGFPAAAPTPARGAGVPPVPPSPTSWNAQGRMPSSATSAASMPSSPRAPREPKPSLAARLAACRLAALQAS